MPNLGPTIRLGIPVPTLAAQTTPPPDLPRPPLVESLLFERPLPAAVAIFLVAGMLAWNALSRGRGRTLLAAALLAALAAGWATLATLVTTDREAVSRRSRELVLAVAQVRIDRVDNILDQDATLTYFRAPAGLARAEILREIERTLGGEYRVKEARVNSVQAAIDGPNLAQTRVHVTVIPEATQFPHQSWWRLDWRRGPDQVWRAFSIEPLAIAGAPADR